MKKCLAWATGRWCAAFAACLVTGIAAASPDSSTASDHSMHRHQTSASAGDNAIVGMRVQNFELLDQSGRPHQLYSAGDAAAIVVMSQGNGCPIVRNAMPALKQLRDRYAADGIAFFLLNSNLQDNSASIASEVAEFDYDMPVLVDTDQLVGEALAITRTAEVFVIATATQRVIYHGPIDDRLTYQVQKGAAKDHYLADALDAVLAGESVKVSNVDAPGCLINFPERDQRQRQARSS